MGTGDGDAPQHDARSGESVLSPTEKELLLARLRLEQDLRAQLTKESDKPTTSRLSAWANSKVGLLLIGALVTGVLVPAFQYTQKAFENQRQDRFEAITTRLQLLRDAHRDLVATSAAESEAYERARLFFGPVTVREGDFAEYRRVMTEVQTRRFAQNARVVAATQYFDDVTRDDAKRALQEYLGKQAAFFATVDGIASTRYCAQFSNACDARDAGLVEQSTSQDRLDDEIEAINETYEKLRQIILNEIEKMEARRATFWL